MASRHATVKEYIDSLPPDRRAAIKKVRAAVNRGLPKGYKEIAASGAIGWVVPHSLYPAGYHCDPRQPVPFAGLASQKNYMAIHLMCVYSDEKHKTWFVKAWKKSGKKLDMGASCVRFKSAEDVPLDVVEEAVRRVPLDRFLAHYEESIPPSARKK
ncbi:MAG: DUF1801 domain-containing protein [Planctomycetota bacterium]|jgi:hypothetical protein